MAKDDNGLVAKIALALMALGMFATCMLFVISAVQAAKAEGERANIRIDEMAPRLERIEASVDKLVDRLVDKK